MNYLTGLPEISVLSLQSPHGSAGSLGGVAWESLSEAGISVRQCTSTRELIATVATGVHPIVVLDASQAPFPAVDVLSVIALLHSSVDAGILLIAGDTLADRICGLNCGADVCLSAPLHGAELVAQVNALHRRFGAHCSGAEAPQADRGKEFHGDAMEEAFPDPSPLPALSESSTTPWLVDRYLPELWTPHAVRVDLTLTEHVLLKEMLRGDRRLVLHERWVLLTGGSQRDQAGGKPSRTFHMTVYRLRRKVDAIARLNLPVRALHGVGYQFCDRLQEISATELVT